MPIDIIRYLARQDPRLGRIIHHDSRSLAYPFVADGTPIRAIRHARYVPVFDQGSTGSCTGNAALGCLGTGPLYAPVAPYVTSWDEELALAIYSRATELDDVTGTYPPDDTGSSGLAVARALRNRGWISGYTHVLSGAAGVAAALQHGPLIIGIPWYQSMFTLTDEHFAVIEPGAQIAGGHEIVVDEYQPGSLTEEGYFGLTNSWGESWGEDGRFYLSYGTMDRLLHEDGDATVLVPITAVPPKPITDPALARLVARTSHWRHSAVPWIGAQGAQRELNRYLAGAGQ